MNATRQSAAPAAMPSSSRRGQPGVRQCAVSRDRLPKDALVRLVLDPEGKVAIDLLDRAPGRGVYVRADRSTLRKALSPKGLGKTFRGRASPLTDDAVETILDGVVQRLEDRLVELVSIARRAQVAALGMDAVLDALAQNPPAPVALTTQDVSERSLKRVLSGVRGGESAPATQVVRLTISKADLGSKLGRNDIGVVAIRPSALASRILAEAARRDGLYAQPQTRAREEGLIRENGEPVGGRSN